MLKIPVTRPGHSHSPGLTISCQTARAIGRASRRARGACAPRLGSQNWQGVTRTRDRPPPPPSQCQASPKVTRSRPFGETQTSSHLTRMVVRPAQRTVHIARSAFTSHLAGEWHLQLRPPRLPVRPRHCSSCSCFVGGAGTGAGPGLPCHPAGTLDRGRLPRRRGRERGRRRGRTRCARLTAGIHQPACRQRCGCTRVRRGRWRVR